LPAWWKKRRTAGTFVSEASTPLARRERMKIPAERVDALLDEANQLGIDVDLVLELVARRDQAMRSQRGDWRPIPPLPEPL
jgi:GntR family transcriptional regulator